MQAEFLTPVLAELNETSADIEASGILSTDGLMITSILPANLDEHKMAAMCAVILALSDSATQELARGSVEQVLIKSAKGYVLITYVGKDTVLAVLTKPNANLDQIAMSIKQAAESIIGLID